MPPKKSKKKKAATPKTKRKQPKDADRPFEDFGRLVDEANNEISPSPPAAPSNHGATQTTAPGSSNHNTEDALPKPFPPPSGRKSRFKNLAELKEWEQTRRLNVSNFPTSTTDPSQPVHHPSHSANAGIGGLNGTQYHAWERVLDKNQDVIGYITETQDWLMVDDKQDSHDEKLRLRSFVPADYARLDGATRGGTTVAGTTVVGTTMQKSADGHNTDEPGLHGSLAEDEDVVPRHDGTSRAGSASKPTAASPDSDGFPLMTKAEYWNMEIDLLNDILREAINRVENLKAIGYKTKSQITIPDDELVFDTDSLESKVHGVLKWVGEWIPLHGSSFKAAIMADADLDKVDNLVKNLHLLGYVNDAALRTLVSDLQTLVSDLSPGRYDDIASILEGKKAGARAGIGTIKSPNLSSAISTDSSGDGSSSPALSGHATSALEIKETVIILKESGLISKLDLERVAAEASVPRVGEGQTTEGEAETGLGITGCLIPSNDENTSAGASVASLTSVFDAFLHRKGEGSPFSKSDSRKTVKLTRECGTATDAPAPSAAAPADFSAAALNCVRRAAEKRPGIQKRVWAHMKNDEVMELDSGSGTGDQNDEGAGHGLGITTEAPHDPLTGFTADSVASALRSGNFKTLLSAMANGMDKSKVGESATTAPRVPTYLNGDTQLLNPWPPRKKRRTEDDSPEPGPSSSFPPASGTSSQHQNLNLPTSPPPSYGEGDHRFPQQQQQQQQQPSNHICKNFKIGDDIDQLTFCECCPNSPLYAGRPAERLPPSPRLGPGPTNWKILVENMKNGAERDKEDDAGNREVHWSEWVMSYTMPGEPPFEALDCEDVVPAMERAPKPASTGTMQRDFSAVERDGVKEEVQAKKKKKKKKKKKSSSRKKAQGTPFAEQEPAGEDKVQEEGVGPYTPLEDSETTKGQDTDVLGTIEKAKAGEDGAFQKEETPESSGPEGQDSSATLLSDASERDILDAEDVVPLKDQMMENCGQDDQPIPDTASRAEEKEDIALGTSTKPSAPEEEGTMADSAYVTSAEEDQDTEESVASEIDDEEFVRRQFSGQGDRPDSAAFVTSSGTVGSPTWSALGLESEKSQAKLEDEIEAWKNGPVQLAGYEQQPEDEEQEVDESEWQDHSDERLKYWDKELDEDGWQKYNPVLWDRTTPETRAEISSYLPKAFIPVDTPVVPAPSSISSSSSFRWAETQKMAKERTAQLEIDKPERFRWPFVTNDFRRVFPITARLLENPDVERRIHDGTYDFEAPMAAGENSYGIDGELTEKDLSDNESEQSHGEQQVPSSPYQAWPAEERVSEQDSGQSQVEQQVLSSPALSVEEEVPEQESEESLIECQDTPSPHVAAQKTPEMAPAPILQSNAGPKTVEPIETVSPFELSEDDCDLDSKWIGVQDTFLPPSISNGEGPSGEYLVGELATQLEPIIQTQERALARISASELNQERLLERMKASEEVQVEMLEELKISRDVQSRLLQKAEENERMLKEALGMMRVMKKDQRRHEGVGNLKSKVEAWMEDSSPLVNPPPEDWENEHTRCVGAEALITVAANGHRKVDDGFDSRALDGKHGKGFGASAEQDQRLIAGGKSLPGDKAANTGTVIAVVSEGNEGERAANQDNCNGESSQSTLTLSGLPGQPATTEVPSGIGRARAWDDVRYEVHWQQRRRQTPLSSSPDMLWVLPHSYDDSDIMLQLGRLGLKLGK